jgi:polar amino acid transport system substrate-binding protein
LGAQLGTTSYDYIVNSIKPSKKPAVFDQNAAAVAALKNKQIDGLVVDLPTAFYVAAAQVTNGKILGQFPTVGTPEHFGMVFEKGNSLVSCVNGALAKLRSDGTLASLQAKWLQADAPVLK